jgi:hypothetical protein
MFNGKNNKNSLSFTIYLLILIFSFSVKAQSTTDVSEDLAIKLQQKVLLTQQQTDAIKASLNEYLADPTEEKRTALDARIESSLDEKQKMKYNIVKKDWWNSVSKRITKEKSNAQ